jgi:hypothetical protein
MLVVHTEEMSGGGAGGNIDDLCRRKVGAVDVSQPLASVATRRRGLGPVADRQRSTGSGVRMTQPSRPVRIPELVLGLVLVVGCALAAVMWNRSITAGFTIVVAASDVPRGSVIDAVDLLPAEVRGGEGVGFVSGDAAADLVGTVALVDITAGEPLTSSMVTATEPLTPEEGLASVALERGQAPSDLGPGDSVRVVVVPIADPVTPSAPTLLELVAEVWDVEPPTEYEPDSVVTLRLPIADAAIVAGAESLRLVRVEP